MLGGGKPKLLLWLSAYSSIWWQHRPPSHRCKCLSKHVLTCHEGTSLHVFPGDISDKQFYKFYSGHCPLWSKQEGRVIGWLNGSLNLLQSDTLWSHHILEGFLARDLGIQKNLDHNPKLEAPAFSLPEDVSQHPLQIFSSELCRGKDYKEKKK